MFSMGEMLCLPTIQSAVETIASMCPGSIHMAVVDLSRVYRQFPVSPLDWPLLGICWRGAWSFDLHLSFGCRMSSYIMQSIAEFIVSALARRGVHTDMYLDDIIVISPTADIAQRDFDTRLCLLAQLGLSVAVSKLQPPSTSVRWLGIHRQISSAKSSVAWRLPRGGHISQRSTSRV